MKHKNCNKYFIYFTKNTHIIISKPRSNQCTYGYGTTPGTTGAEQADTTGEERTGAEQAETTGAEQADTTGAATAERTEWKVGDTPPTPAVQVEATEAATGATTPALYTLGKTAPAEATATRAARRT